MQDVSDQFDFAAKLLRLSFVGRKKIDLSMLTIKLYPHNHGKGLM